MGISGFATLNIVLAAVLLRVSATLGQAHNDAAERQPDNKAPILVSPLPDLDIRAGEAFLLELSGETFMDPDVGDAMKYEAYRYPSDRLPPWIRFDPLNRHFVFEPPPASSGSVKLRLVARDYDGLEAEVCFTVSYGN
jgi:hypothetical protein